ncbi:hypothetical protein [Psychrobium sp. 1_MG-2023]|uniref:hypothetical protein n=1 Tax=Psychrobium sp. 1_MG-2023 TaxID=3062624 RepID=UPI000C342FEF|nr:hypothetical protein [Psychrobium sp. 1_MG-2023]MDP2559520.1 hypothetical protein [Psychrobium sp. 1_MG-2023]PKF59360.1 hypothetical protein CW748_00880 [Alteromonadales bacterium alter-6D02]
MLRFIYLITLLGFSSISIANETKEVSIAEKIQELKQRAASLHKDLDRLERDLLFPSATQVAVYVALNEKKSAVIDTIEIRINGQSVSSFAYNDNQKSALLKGGKQRLYNGNIAQGEFQVSAKVEGTTNSHQYSLMKEKRFYKSKEALSLEVSVALSSTNQPVITLIKL